MHPCILLFGSLARGDGGERSDVDLLVSEDTGAIRNSRVGRVEVQFTPKNKLLQMAALGDLFAIHLVKEARVITDPDNFFGRLTESLVVKRSYQSEIDRGLSLAAYLIKERIAPDRMPLKNKRLAWCARTVLISKIVERGMFVFSPKKLEEIYPEPEISILLSLRREARYSEHTDAAVDKFLRRFGGDKFLGMSIGKLQEVFREQCNEIGEATVASLRRRSRTSPLSSFEYVGVASETTSVN